MNQDNEETPMITVLRVVLVEIVIALGKRLLEEIAEFKPNNDERKSQS